MVTPFGLRVTLPVLEIAQGRYIAFLGHSMPRSDSPKRDMVWLALRVAHITPSMNQGQPPIYHCSWPGSPRCITISGDLASELGKKSKQMDIRISLRPTYREGALLGPQHIISRLMASSPQRPFHFKPSSIARWERDYKIKLLDVKLPPESPWTESSQSPTILVFECPDGGGHGVMVWMILVVGCCSRETSSTRNQSFRGIMHYTSVYYCFDGYQEVHSLISAYEDKHDCKLDHLTQVRSQGDTYQHVYKSSTKITDLGPWRQQLARLEQQQVQLAQQRVQLEEQLAQLKQEQLPQQQAQTPFLEMLLWYAMPEQEPVQELERRWKKLKQEQQELEGQLQELDRQRLGCNIRFNRMRPTSHIATSLEVDIRSSVMIVL